MRTRVPDERARGKRQLSETAAVLGPVERGGAAGCDHRALREKERSARVAQGGHGCCFRSTATATATAAASATATAGAGAATDGGGTCGGGTCGGGTAAATTLLSRGALGRFGEYGLDQLDAAGGSPYRASAAQH